MSITEKLTGRKLPSQPATENIPVVAILLFQQMFGLTVAAYSADTHPLLARSDAGGLQ